jgi:predicted PolB exonuclease-like 3'-5' exonuclease
MLRHDITDRVWFFDLEWVPDATGARRLYSLPEETTELQAFERLWAEAGASENTPRPFLKYYLSRVVSIAFLQRRVVYRGADHEVNFSLHSLPRDPTDHANFEESQIINEFLHWLGKKRPQLVGFNSAEADMQVLVQRGLINEVSAPMFCQRPANRWDHDDYFQRWDNEWHLDLLQKLSSGRLRPNLNDLAKLCGFPGKLDVDGTQVADLWLNRDLVKIIEYNQIDTLNTYLLWLRFVLFCGKLNEEEYAAELESFKDFLDAESQKPDKEFVGEFRNKWEL